MALHRALERKWPSALALWFVLGLCLIPSARGGDRPFLSTASAAAEEDDDGVWSAEVTLQRLRPVRALGLSVEYAFSPTDAAQVELGRASDRDTGESLRAVGFEYKHLFNHIARDGYGVGLVLSLERAKPSGSGWEGSQWSIVAPASIHVGGPSTLLHLNLGVTKARDAAREWSRSLAIEHELFKRTVVFAELARSGEEKLSHGGVRYWVQREKLAFDLAWQRVTSEGVGRRGWVLGLGWYDL